MTTVRAAAVAGTFYPADAVILADMVDRFLDDAAVTDALPVKAIIAPHAGYIYSGPIAASAYAALAAGRPDVRRAVLIGPAHRVAVEGLATSSAYAFATPLGEVPVDQEAVASTLALPQVQVWDEAHAFEHGLEVHLPFLQRLYPGISIVPFVAGRIDQEAVAALLDLLWGGPETAVIISSDLSHYFDYAAAQHLDRQTAEAITRLDSSALGPDSACGRYAIRGLLLEARKKGLKARLLDLRNSGDTSGSRDRVVGYGAFIFS
ncbi:MAG: AmmeMemoRadiSam system protein B [Candidatus Promineifilaceae bacterium]